MAEITLAAETGRPTGSRASGRLRAQGKIPGVVYGLGKDPVPVAVNWRELRQALTGEAGLNALIDLQVDGGTELVMVKELQRHPVRREVLHVDFLRVDPEAEVTVEVPIILVGEARQVVAEGGAVEQVLHSLTVHAKPQAIPNELQLDVSELTMGQTLRVGDLQLPAGVSAAIDPEEPVVATVAGSQEAAAEAEAEAGEGEAAAEGGEAAGGAEAGGEPESSGGEGE